MSCNNDKLFAYKCDFAELVYTKYQQDAYGLKQCSSTYTSDESEQLKLKIDQLSYCSLYKCANPD